jgi:hypothetical protein
MNLTKMTLQDSSGKVESQGQLTEAFGIERSLRRGDALSVQYCSGERDKEYRDQTVWKNFLTERDNLQRQYADVLILGHSATASE